eukprot:6287093-Prymnesium_polylepis.1
MHLAPQYVCGARPLMCPPLAPRVSVLARAPRRREQVGGAGQKGAYRLPEKAQEEWPPAVWCRHVAGGRCGCGRSGDAPRTAGWPFGQGVGGGGDRRGRFAAHGDAHGRGGGGGPRRSRYV